MEKTATRPAPTKKDEVKTVEGLPISCSQVRRLEGNLRILQEQYDSLKIKQLTHHPTETDAAKVKADLSKMEAYRKEIKKIEGQILLIKLHLK